MGASKIIAGKVLSVSTNKALCSIELEIENRRIVRVGVAARPEGYKVGSRLKVLCTKNRTEVVD